MFVRELSDGCEIEQVLLVREAETRRGRGGAELLRICLADRTGAVTAIVTDGVTDAAAHAQPGAAVHVCGHHAVHPRYGPQVEVASLRPAHEGEYALGDLL